MARLQRVTIVGLGLIGGSLGLALTRARAAREIVGLSRHRATGRHAVRRGAIDRGTTDPDRAVADADIVVLATPVSTIVHLAKRLAPLMPRGAIITDVGSAKGAIVQALERSLPAGISFVGAHPLAGSEQQGLAAAHRDLFHDSCCIVTRTRRTDHRALHMVSRMWEQVGACVCVMAPARHDHLLAQVSHLPHALAFCLAQAVTPAARRVAPRSFLEMTRIANSDAALWRDILLTNRPALLKAMRAFEHEWATLTRLIRQRDAHALEQFLRHAQRLHQSFSN